MGQLGIGDGLDYGNSGDSIPVKMPNGTIVNAIAATPINTSSILIAVTDSGTPYAFANPSIPEIGDQEIARSRSKKKDIFIEEEYPFKVLSVVVEGISIQGFNEDALIENTEIQLARKGFVNTGDSYVAIVVLQGDLILIGETLVSVTEGMFTPGYAINLNWYGGDALFSIGTIYGDYSSYVYSYVATGSTTSVSLHPSAMHTWSEWIGIITIPFHLTTRAYSFGLPSQGTMLEKVDWTVDLTGDIYNSYSYTGKSRQTQIYDNRTVDSIYYDNYAKEYSDLTPSGLTTSLKQIEKKTIANVERNIQGYPSSTSYTWTNYRLDTITGSVTRNETLLEFNKSYTDTPHKTKIDYNYSWTKDYEYRDNYSYLHRRVTYNYVFSWNDSGTGTANSTNIDLTWDYAEGEIASPSDWTIEFGEVLGRVGGNQYLRGYIWYYRVTNPDGNIVPGYYFVPPGTPLYGWNFLDDSAQTVKRNYEYFDFNDQHGGVNGDGWFPIENITPGYIYATQPTSNGGTFSSESWVNIGYPLTNTKLYVDQDTLTVTTVDNSDCDLILTSVSQSTVLYWFYAERYDETITQYEQYSQDYTNAITIIRPNVYERELIKYNPNTYTLCVKHNDVFYEIKDFDEINGFDFNNRLYAYNTNSISQPNIGSNTFACTFNIGLRSNNKGDYTVIRKQTSALYTGTTYINHPLVVFDVIGLEVDCYYVSSGNVEKYTGIVTNVSYNTYNDDNGTYRAYNSMTINITSVEQLDFVCWVNEYSNGIFITSASDYTRFIIEYLDNGLENTNLYDVDTTFRLAIAKKLASDNLDGEDEWFADIYEFDIVNKIFIRVGNESGSLSEITGTEYRFISYYPS